MDSFKTGEFIKNLRVEKGLTQKELAEALNCTDKAISRWETGKGFPDIVFLTPLAQTLGVSVNELLAGERLSQEELVSKSDEVIISTMQEAENSRQKIEKVIFAVLCAVPIVTMYLVIIFNSSPEFLISGVILSAVCCMVAGLLKINIKFALPLIVVVSFLPLHLIREGFDDLYPFLLMGSITLFVGMVLIGIITAIKELIKRLYAKWKTEDNVIKAVTAISLVLSIVLGIVGIAYYEKYTEEINVIEHIDNDETHIDELIYNGHKYYECGSNFFRSNYKKLFAHNDVFPEGFPYSITPYELKKQIDLSICIEYLPELEKGQKYIMPKNEYFIYSNDSITHPTIIYIYEDSSYYEWFVSEDFDFKMPTTDTHEIVDVVLYGGDSYDNVVARITDENKIKEIANAKENGEDISKYVTTEEYGNWTDIYINYKDSPFSERIGFLQDDGKFTYTKSWEEWNEENPHWYYEADDGWGHTY